MQLTPSAKVDEVSQKCHRKLIHYFRLGTDSVQRRDCRTIICFNSWIHSSWNYVVILQFICRNERIHLWVFTGRKSANHFRVSWLTLREYVQFYGHVFYVRQRLSERGKGVLGMKSAGNGQCTFGRNGFEVTADWSVIGTKEHVSLGDFRSKLDHIKGREDLGSLLKLFWWNDYFFLWVECIKAGLEVLALNFDLFLVRFRLWMPLEVPDEGKETLAKAVIWGGISCKKTNINQWKSKMSKYEFW